MEYVRLGSAGLQVSRICLGMMSYGTTAERAWHLDEAAAEPPLSSARRRPNVLKPGVHGVRAHGNRGFMRCYRAPGR